MSNRKQRIGSSNKSFAFIATVLIHAVIVGALFFNFTSKSKPVDAAYAEKVDVVKATTVDSSQLQKKIDELKKKELDKKKREKEELERLKKLKQESEKEKKRLEDLKEKQKEEKQKAIVEEKKRKEIALKKKKEQEKRKKEEEKRKKKAAEKKKRQEAERKRKKDQQDAELKRRLEESLAAEEAFQANQRANQMTTTLQAKYYALISNSVQSKLNPPIGSQPRQKPLVNVKLSSSGDVQSVRIIESSGDRLFDRAAESAVLKATPLPIPSRQEHPTLYKEFLDINLRVRIR